MSGKTVSIPLETAQQALELFRNVEAADAHFQTCQSIPFRQHVRSVYRAPNVEAAYRDIAAAVEKAEEAPDNVAIKVAMDNSANSSIQSKPAVSRPSSIRRTSR